MSDRKNEEKRLFPFGSLNQQGSKHESQNKFLAQEVKGAGATIKRPKFPRLDSSGNYTKVQDATQEQIIKERNKRLMAWMASVLNLQHNERPIFYIEISELFTNATDEVIAKVICNRLPPLVFAEDLEGAQKLISHFESIAEGWLANTSEDARD